MTAPSFLFTGRAPEEREWQEFLITFHTRHPGTTSRLFTRLQTADGQTSYHVLAAEVSRSLAQGASVLDVGCGDGTLLSRVAAIRGDLRLNGLDLVESDVQLGRQRLPNADLRAGDMAKLPWADATFDAVVSHLVIPGAFDARASVSEVQRVLKPGALFVAVVQDFQRASSYVALLGAAVRAIRKRHPKFGLTFHSSENDEPFRDVLAHAGLHQAATCEFEVGMCVTPDIVQEAVTLAYPFGMLSDEERNLAASAAVNVGCERLSTSLMMISAQK